MHVCPKKGLVPELPPFKDMLCNREKWLLRLKSVQYMMICLLQATCDWIDEIEENQLLKNMADGLEDPSGEHGRFFWALQEELRKKYGLLEDKRKDLFYPELTDAKGKKTKRALMNEHEKEKHDLWLFFNEVVWNVEKIRFLKNESSYSEPKDYCKYCLDWAKQEEAQWLFPSRKRKRESNEFLP